MPDRHGFNHLGDDVCCIDCPTGGPIGRWPEHKRATHARRHNRTPELQRQRNLLAAPPNPNPSEEKEATTMATTSKGEPAKQVAIDILREAGKPLHAKEIATRVLASGRCAGLKGKTPEATISAMLAVGSKPGGPFKRVDKGTYSLAESAQTSTPAPPLAPAGDADQKQAGQPAASKPTQTTKPAAASKPTQSRKPARAQKPKRTAAKRRPAKRTR